MTFLPARTLLPRTAWPISLLLAAIAVGCSRPKTGNDGTAMMADTLARLNANAMADPVRNQFLSRERADLLQSMVSRLTGPAAVENRFALAQERLRAGQVREAIAQLDTLGLSAPVPPDPLRNKGYFDLLGIAWLRLGEQENCAFNPAASVCILPLAGAARHERQEGARRSIEVYDRVLRAVPNDPGTRWLLNIAHLALGQYPNRVPPGWLIPNLGSRRDTTFPVFPNVAWQVGAAIQGTAGGLCVEDFNQDGYLDLFTTSWGLNDPVHLLLADGQGGYRDATEGSGLKGIVGGLNCVQADYDNDGDTDILILRGAWLGDAGTFPNSLLQNRGEGRFADVTFEAGLGSMHPRNSAAWADFNLDGHLDLFVGNESQVRWQGKSHRSELFLNHGDGTFSEVSHRVGIDLDEFVKGVAWGDVNNDGLPDLYASVLFGPNRLYLNRGGRSLGSWRFEEVAHGAGVQSPVASFPVWFWDYDNDGWEDLLVLSYDVRNGGALVDAVALEYLGAPPLIPVGNARVPVESSRLYHNQHNGTFADVTREAGLADKVIFAMGSNFGDLDNDGFLDFYVGTGNPDIRSVIPNRMFHGVEGSRFQEVSVEGGFAHLQKGHGTAFVDLDGDGDQDVFMVIGGAYPGDRFTSVLFENPGWDGRAWIALELEGRSANRSAIGARVEIVASDSAGSTRTVHRTVGTGGSFGSGSLRLHVGLGQADRVEQVRVTWPDADRSQSVFSNLAARRTYRIVQGAEPVGVERAAIPFRRTPQPESHQHPNDGGRW